MATAAVSVLAVDYFHTSPIHEISLATPEDHTAVGAFLVVGLLTSAVANVARSRAAEADRAVEQARLLAEQRAALRRVATLVARGVSPSEIFMAVAEEIARFLKLDSAEVVRYEDDGSACIVAESGSRVWRVGDRRTLEGDNVAAMVLRTGRPARMDTYEDAQGL
jgi:K+-sensing histidine kinase KdpD